ncbi:tyrosine-type recombinase/integrase [Sphingomonas sanguinis]|uniref:tyrosine-type recombinase/integrase n=1 Tax=Sphingomonas sp. LC-1 TaxID=3110957 RepID=UPI0021BB3ED6|nr:tyrosine-type recombinase/integrase [Sphingomonas sp. LC-1]MCT8000589.1 tyrosine-type recombinase/integrase [Sphingomonas sp. LC-1]
MADATLPYTMTIRKTGGRKGTRELWYFRHASLPGPPTRLPGLPGEPAFNRLYEQLKAQVEKTTIAAKQAADETSIRSLVNLYRASDEWTQLSAKTRTDYGRELDRLCDMVGDLPYSRLTSAGVRALRKQVKAATVASRQAAIDARAARDAAVDDAWEARVARLRAKDKPIPERPKNKRKPPAPITETTGARTADYFKSVVSTLMEWSINQELVTVNAAFGVKKLHRKKNVDGRKPWTEHQIQHAIDHGPRHIRDGVILGAYTGQRLRTCCNMTKAQCVGPMVRIRQEKTGNLVDVVATGPLVNLVARRRGSNDDDDAAQLLLQDDGSPYSERLYSDHLRRWLDDQGWHDISFHGLRYSAAGTLNEAGATVATITSIIGHSTYQMALKYLSAREEQQRAAAIMKEAAKRRESEE